MSKYTTEIRFICETYSVNAIIEQAIPKIFDFDFPIFDENYRNVLCKKILKHYYTREIAFETIGLWKLKIDTKLNEIMPYYNELYKSSLLEFNPFYDVELERKHKTDNTGSQKMTGNIDSAGTSHTVDDIEERQQGEQSTNSTTDNDGQSKQTTTLEDTQTSNKVHEESKQHTDVYSETPQGALTNVENLTYLTDARKVTDVNNTTQTDNIVNTSENEVITDNENTTQLRENIENDSRKNVDSVSTTTTNNNAESESNTIVSNTEDYLETVKGKQGSQSYASLLKEFRETFLNIDMLIIDELSDLFFNLW